MNKIIGVLFSSGLDSTYLVWKNLKDGNKVIPLYVEIENNQSKTIMEKNRIGLLLKEFQKEFNVNDKYIEDIHNVVNISINGNGNGLHFNQIPIWLLSMVFIQGMGLDEIQIGYVCGDDVIPYLEDIQTIYKSYQTICDPMIPLVFPLTKKKKWQMVQELPKQYMDLIFSCENPKIIGSEDANIIDYEACCECVPCKSIISSDYYETGHYPKNYEKPLIKKQIYSLYRQGYKVFDKNGLDYIENMSTLVPRLEPHQLRIRFDFDEDEDVDYEKSCYEPKIRLDYE